MDYAAPSHSAKAMRLNVLWSNLSDTKRFLRKYRYVLGIAAVLLFVFYWFQIRPIHVNSVCSADASLSARTLLQTKAEITTNAAQKATYAQMVQQNLYLRTDYESFYKKCMRSHGFFQS